MIQDILFSLLIPQSGRMAIEDFVNSDSENVQNFLHPGERKILEDIIHIAKQYQDIIKFTKTHGICLKGSPAPDATEEPLQKGSYLQAFAEGIDKVLEDDYMNEIVELEQRYLQNPTHSLLFVYHKVEAFQPLFSYLKTLIDGIRSQKLHGCAIMQYLHQNMLHGSQKITNAMIIIFNSVNVVFLKQLTHWILYGKVMDTYGEFFIQSYESRNTSITASGSEKYCSTSVGSCSTSGRNTAATTSTTDVTSTSTYAEVWRYEICCEFLPYYLTYSWAEKVLFIGQTVLMFKMGVNKRKEKSFDWWNIDQNDNDDDTKSTTTADKATTSTAGNHHYHHRRHQSTSLWNNEEHKYFHMIRTLYNGDDDADDDDDNDDRDDKDTTEYTSNREVVVVVSEYEKIIDEIKSFVTQRLSQIAVVQADLIKQLKLIKDFYLLGRGELFLEFIKATYSMSRINATPTTISEENTLRDLVRAFDSAAQSINITDELDSFSLYLCKTKAHTFDVESFACFQYLCLQYKIEWPLHLLFSPKVLERYNELFRFLLLVKKMQYELHLTWALNRKDKSHDKIQLMHLLHQLMFLIDNLQYYIQADVLESQFSILMNTVLNSSDFENIQRAHSIFHANVLSLCFLLSNDDQTSNTQTSMLQCSENPVLTILNKVFRLCEVFCVFTRTCHTPLSLDECETNDLLEKQLSKLIKDLMNLLVGLKIGPNSTPLAQLLLRLDFNYWFSRGDDDEVQD